MYQTISEECHSRELGGKSLEYYIKAMNAAILAVEMLALADEAVAERLAAYKATLGQKIEKANRDLAEVKYMFKTN